MYERKIESKRHKISICFMNSQVRSEKKEEQVSSKFSIPSAKEYLVFRIEIGQMLLKNKTKPQNLKNNVENRKKIMFFEGILH